MKGFHKTKKMENVQVQKHPIFRHLKMIDVGEIQQSDDVNVIESTEAPNDTDVIWVTPPPLNQTFIYFETIGEWVEVVTPYYFNNIPTYDSDSDAINGGLLIGDVYECGSNHESCVSGVLKKITA